MKTTQAQIVIADLLNKKVVFDIEADNTNVKALMLLNDCRDIILSKIGEIFTANVYWYNTNETRETIIQALEIYQESLLPKGYSLVRYLNSEKINIEKFQNIHDYLNFYNPQTRIITVYKLEEE